MSTETPPSPPRPAQAFKIRRRRASRFPTLEEQLSDMPSAGPVIPSIEMSEPDDGNPSPLASSQFGSLSSCTPYPPILRMERLLTPMQTDNRKVTPPPPTTPGDWLSLSRSAPGGGRERSQSICSSLSDSSISSCGSSSYSTPYVGGTGGSCTSPDSDGAHGDPFVDFTDKSLPEGPPFFLEHGDSPSAKRIKVHRSPKWTQSMDDHLLRTYMEHLLDPRLTPFKSLPGTAPPLGLCTRVASKARRTWSGRQASRSVSPMLVDGEDATLRAAADRMQFWPRSDSATRRRLRYLCKRRAGVAPYYSRLLRMRTPSPFLAEDSSMGRTEGPSLPTSTVPSVNSAEPFSSRDLSVSLATATAPSMQPEGPLAQLTSRGKQPLASSPPALVAPQRPKDWFARIHRSQAKAHQKSLSLQDNLQLASPFNDDGGKDRSHLLQSMEGTRSLGRTGQLASPFESSSGAPTMPRSSLKRRFRSDEDKPKRPVLPDYFRSQPQIHTGEDVFTSSITPGLSVSGSTPFKPTGPSAITPEDNSFPGRRPGLMNTLPRLKADPVPRLGSPFHFHERERQRVQSNTFPRRHLSDYEGSNGSAAFWGRLREIVEHENSKSPHPNRVNRPE
ncbi:hypothetical protein K470DRAFT_268603 [Piedraia hortae CBS 480.64]|uniref:Uncharacterized protein n=1 Tax=Piedraia hortae CBS 480.64 TaxID=1314780 RepID=A0A6A7C6E6_9PEZI|nr:hypothetical protein K470DRAFT_268603 [Piedraia hortae CBS 480.64]